MKKIILFNLLLSIIFGIFPTTNLQAQEPVIFESEGKDFWFTFLPNYHNYEYYGNVFNTDSLYIFITSKIPTKGTIYYNVSDVPMEHNFEIKNPSDIYKFPIFYRNVALLGYNQSGIIDKTNNDCEKIVERSRFKLSVPFLKSFLIKSTILLKEVFLLTS